MLLQSVITSSGQTLDIGHLTVLVGPNNSGKSQTLRDILQYFQSALNNQNPNMKVLGSVNVAVPTTYAELTAGLTIERLDHSNGYAYKVTGGERGVPNELAAWQYQQLQTAGPQETVFRQFAFQRLMGRLRYLNAESRLKSASSDSSADGLLRELYDDPTKAVEQELRAAFREAFNLDIKLDYSSREALSLRVGENLENIPVDPRDAQPLLSQEETIEQQGDGFRSFVGVVLSVLLSRNRLILIDEPEAFLHQAQARVLGRLIAQLARRIEGQVLISTHSSSFLTGLLDAEQGVQILRLNRNGRRTTFTRMPADVSARLTTEPLLASQRVVEALFQEGVVVCEADRDRLVYQAVAIRDLKDQGIFFLHADNKQTLHHVVSVMQQLAVPATAIADIDILNDDANLNTLLRAFGDSPEVGRALEARTQLAGVLQGEEDATIMIRLRVHLEEFLVQLRADEHGLAGARSALKRLLDDTNSGPWVPLKKGGTEGVPEPARTYARQAIDACLCHGLCVVPVGELEQWVPLAVRKKEWPTAALNIIYANQTPEALKAFVGEVLSAARRTPRPLDAAL